MDLMGVMGDAPGMGLWSACIILARLGKSVIIREDMRGNICFILPNMRYLYIFTKPFSENWFNVQLLNFNVSTSVERQNEK